MNINDHDDNDLFMYLFIYNSSYYIKLTSTTITKRDTNTPEWNYGA